MTRGLSRDTHCLGICMNTYVDLFGCSACIQIISDFSVQYNRLEKQDGNQVPESEGCFSGESQINQTKSLCQYVGSFADIFVNTANLSWRHIYYGLDMYFCMYFHTHGL